MYKGFNLDLIFNKKEKDDFYKIGLLTFKANKNNVSETLKDLILTNGNFDGSTMQENWFPQIQADIFISHSHNDEKTAITLAGWLDFSFGIKAFIDSCIWGYSNDLLKLIDNQFCLQKDGYYSYKKRNFSTSHVHMMLSTALNMMIDNTECLFFLNTPNSVTTSDVINSTLSPWIYSEITMSKLIRKKELSNYRTESLRMFSEGGKIQLNESIEYRLDINHLTDINRSDLINWFNAYNHNNTEYPLDTLYRHHKII
jgi:hypothetical protein